MRVLFTLLIGGLFYVGLPDGLNAQSVAAHDSRFYSGPRIAFPVSLLPGDILQGPAVHFGLNPLGLCFDAVGSVHGVPTIYIAELSSGLTYLYAADGLHLLGTIPSPTGVQVVSGLTTDGAQLYWVADETLYRTDMSGGNLEQLGPLNLPGAGLAGDICLGDAQDLWVVDVVADQYSRHSLLDGSYLGTVFASPSGVSAFGLGIARRSDCGLFEIPHGSLAEGRVTEVSVVDSTGLETATSPIGFVGSFLAGVDVAVPSPGSGVYSMFVVDPATGSIFEVEGIDPCPLTSTDCHASPATENRFSYSLPVETYEITPASPVSNSNDLISNIDVLGFTGQIEDLEVAIEITHTFVGDLDISLISPAGDVTVQLHDSAGLASDNINTVFSDAGRPYGPPFHVGDRMRPSGPGTLSDFSAVNTNGLWSLVVTDNFAGEDGVLDSWSLSVPHSLAIPDGDATAAEATITIAETVNPQQIIDLDVELQLTHADHSQLGIDLTSPLGTTVRLHNQSAGSGTLVERFDDPPLAGGFNDGFGTSVPSGPGSLADFDEQSPTGVWLLQVIDTTVGQVGTLEGVELRICTENALPQFIRGDVAPNGSIDIADAVALLEYLFLNGILNCQSAADTDDTGRLDLADPIFILYFLFANGSEPPAPGLQCGPDQTEDVLECELFEGCI